MYVYCHHFYELYFVQLFISFIRSSAKVRIYESYEQYNHVCERY